MLFISLISSVLLIIVVSGDQQSVMVNGTLTCNGKPATGVVVKLVDKDRRMT